MPAYSLCRRLLAEAFGTGMLVATVVGSGIMASSMTDDRAVALLGNTVPTGAILVVLISVLGPISGAHFNPAVSMVFAIRGELRWKEMALFAAAQFAGAVMGTILAHAMFDQPLLQIASQTRTGVGQWLSEGVAAFGLVAVILGGLRSSPQSLPWLVGLYITAAYWFTASTSFANPAVTVARSLTDTFAGIRPLDVPGFIVAQLCGAAASMAFVAWLLHPERR